MAAGTGRKAVHDTRRFLQQEQIGPLTLDERYDILNGRAGQAQKIPTNDFHSE
jgi:hypothetical protein